MPTLSQMKLYHNQDSEKEQIYHKNGGEHRVKKGARYQEAITESCSPVSQARVLGMYIN